MNKFLFCHFHSHSAVFLGKRLVSENSSPEQANQAATKAEQDISEAVQGVEDRLKTPESRISVHDSVDKGFADIDAAYKAARDVISASNQEDAAAFTPEERATRIALLDRVKAAEATAKNDIVENDQRYFQIEDFVDKGVESRAMFQRADASFAQLGNELTPAQLENLHQATGFLKEQKGEVAQMPAPGLDVQRTSLLQEFDENISGFQQTETSVRASFLEQINDPEITPKLAAVQAALDAEQVPDLADIKALSAHLENLQEFREAFAAAPSQADILTAINTQIASLQPVVEKAQAIFDDQSPEYKAGKKALAKALANLENAKRNYEKAPPDKKGAMLQWVRGAQQVFDNQNAWVASLEDGLVGKIGEPMDLDVPDMDEHVAPVDAPPSDAAPLDVASVQPPKKPGAPT